MEQLSSCLPKQSSLLRDAVVHTAMAVALSCCQVIQKKKEPSHAPVIISESEAQAAFGIMRRELGASYPLPEKIPLVQEKIDSIGKEISNQLISGTLPTSLRNVRQYFIGALSQRFGVIENTDVTISLLPITFENNEYKFCELSAFVCGRTYSVSLGIPEILYQTPEQRTTTAEELTTQIVENMKVEFLIHLHEKIGLLLLGEVVNDEAIPYILHKLRPFLIEESDGFKSIGNTLSGKVSIREIGNGTMLNIIFGTINGDSVRIGVPLSRTE